MIYCVCRTHTHTHTHMRAHTSTRHLATIAFAAFAPFGDTIGRHLATIASGIRRVCLPATRSGTPAYGTHTGVGFNFRTFRLLTRVRDLLRLPDTHTHTHTHKNACAHLYATPGHIYVCRVCTIWRHHWATPDHYCEWL